MTITQKEIDRKIKWIFEIYEKAPINGNCHQYQLEEFHRMTGKIIAMLEFGLITEEKCHELWDRATELYEKAEGAE